MIPKLKIIASNATEVTIGNTTLYFSYETCVAFSCPSGNFKTEKRYSQTTSKHLGFFGAKEFTPCSDEVFNSLLNDLFNKEPRINSSTIISASDYMHQWTIGNQKESV
jgi:hypothetical protein